MDGANPELKVVDPQISSQYLSLKQEKDQLDKIENELDNLITELEK